MAVQGHEKYYEMIQLCVDVGVYMYTFFKNTELHEITCRNSKPTSFIIRLKIIPSHKKKLTTVGSKMPFIILLKSSASNKTKIPQKNIR